jgi:phosphoribosylglycinamide formyltransferase-1
MSEYSEKVTSLNPLRIAVFASGAGSNALALMRHFNRYNSNGKVILLLSNKPDCGAVKHAAECDVEVLILTRENFYAGDEVIRRLKQLKVDLLVLAGFLWKIPPFLVTEFEGRIINLHPSLLPKYGGKGMYGRRVHEAVYNAKESVTGITLHFVNEKYDDGKIIFQASVSITPEDGIDEIEKKVKELEMQYFCKVIQEVVLPLSHSLLNQNL